MRKLTVATLLSVFSCVAPSPVIMTAWQLRFPWVYPGDFNERITRSDLIVSGTIAFTARGNIRTVDGVEVTTNAAEIRIDRVFKGEAKATTLKFLWFTPPPVAGGVIYSGPPLTDFKPAGRYLVFLRHEPTGFVVTIPIVAIEVRLGPVQQGSPSDVSQVPLNERNLEIAKELEAAALSVPEPAPGVTGEAATYFPSVVDLLGGCAEPFLRHFAASRSKELGAAAQNWLALLVNKGLHCASARQLS